MNVYEPPALFELNPPPRPFGSTYRTTIYQLDQVSATIRGLWSALNHDYLRGNDFRVEERQVGTAPALLVHGVVPCDRAEWCDVLATLTGADLRVGYSSAGSALLIALPDRVYALTYGTVGRYMVNLERANPSFGIGFAVRSLAPQDIKRIRRRVLGLNSRVDHNFVPGGQHIRLFGIDKWGEIVGQVCGKAFNHGLTACRRTGRAISIEGSDSLRIELGDDPTHLLADLREIDRVCRRQSPEADLEFITQLRPIQSGDPRLPELQDRVDDQLGADNPVDLGLAVPGPLVAEIERARSYRVRVPYSRLRATPLPDLTLHDILWYTNRIEPGKRWEALRTGRISMFADADGREDGKLDGTPAYRWISAQLAHGSHQLLLHEGEWFEIGADHLKFLHQEIEQLLTQPPSLVLPPWGPDLKDEDSYNRHAAEIPGFALLDRQLLKTAQHSRGRGIEACDLLGPGLELIHVKRAAKSAPLSHLFEQGIVSVDALKYEADAREQLVELVHAKNPDHPIGADFQPRKVVYAIALDRGKPLTAATLFTLAQVALYRAVKVLRGEGVEVEVIGIPT